MWGKRWISNKRVSQHLRDLMLGREATNTARILQHAWDEEGPENFEAVVLERVFNNRGVVSYHERPDNLSLAEHHYINERAEYNADTRIVRDEFASLISDFAWRPSGTSVGAAAIQSSAFEESFPDYMHEEIGYYVYRLTDPRDEASFYVGKGVGNRVFQHVAEAISNEDRSTLKLDRIRDIRNDGLRVMHTIHRHGLTEKEAFEVEAALIDAYGLSHDALSKLTNLQGGRGSGRGVMSAGDLIATYAIEEVEFHVPVLVLKLSRQFEHRLTDEELYERTRGLWKINPFAHRNVRYAMPVSLGGVIREVYHIMRWIEVDVTVTEESPLRRRDVDAASKSKYRWMFEGRVDQEMRVRYVGKRVPNVRVQIPTLWRGPASTSMEGPDIHTATKT